MSKFEKFYLENIEQVVVGKKRESIAIAIFLVLLIAAIFIYRSSSCQRIALKNLVEVKNMQSQIKKLSLTKDELKLKFSEIAKKGQKSDLKSVLETALKSVDIEFKSEWNAKMKSTPVPLVAKSIFYQTLACSIEGLDLKKMLSFFQVLSKTKELEVSDMEIIAIESKFTVNFSVGMVREKA